MSTLILMPTVGMTELVHQFNSPSFNGLGYSSHTLTVYQLEMNRKQKLKDEAAALQSKAELAIKNSNLSKFLVNVESRIYAQLSKQLADAMFAESSADNGSLNFQGTSISWFKTATEVTLVVTETNGNKTEITVPIASFSF